MNNRIRFVSVLLIIISICPALCLAEDVTHLFGPIEWSFQGKPVPETYWSPWLPVVQTGFRFKVGFLFSTGTITIKAPIKLTFRYDPQAVRSGQDFTFGVKAEPAGTDNYTFQSAFGLSFPNKIQLGFVGVSGVPISLPWFDLPLDFWELVAKIPKVGEPISSAVSNIGVNTSTKDGLPLGKTDSYHNERDLITVEISKYKVEDLAPEVLGKIPEDVRTNAVRLIKLANYCSDAEALDKLEEYTEKALSVLYDAPTLTLKGDPYFKLEGVRLRASFRVFIPGGKGSGLYTVYFDNPNQFQTITFRDITPFIDAGDKLTIQVQELAYEFRLIQGLTASCQISVVPINLANVEKTVTYTTVVKDTTGDPFKVEVPIQPASALVQGLYSRPGCTSVLVNWASPSVPLKSTVKAYDGQTLAATVVENAFKTAHNVIVPGLQSGRTYRLVVTGVNQSGQDIPGGETTATTASGPCPERVESATCNTLTLSNPSATAGSDYIDFSWTTNELASTEVMFSPSPDLSLNYIMAVKKVGDVVTQGWITREGPRQFETNHRLRLAGLEPNTKYYYNLRSWTFANNDETGNAEDRVGHTGSITTLPGFPPPAVKISVVSPSEGNKVIPDVPVIITKNTDVDFSLGVSTGTTGISPEIELERGTSYTFTVQPNGCYQGGETQLEVAANAQGQLPPVVINLDRLAPRRGYVYKDQNAATGLAGAIVSGKNSQGQNISTTTASNGSWVFDGLAPGSYTFTVSKEGYRTTTVNATVTPCGRFTGLSVTMVPRSYQLNLTVKNQANQVVKNANVVIKEGQTTIGTLTTDLMGKASKEGTFNDDNEHIFTIEVTPPESSTANIMPAQDFVSITSASVRDITITCPADKTGPVPSEINISQAGQRAIQLRWKVDDENAKSCLEYQKPDGNISTTAWKAGLSSAGSGLSEHAATIQGSSLKAGNYKIKIKTKDKWNNIGESPIREFNLFGEGLWDFKVEQSGSTVTFTWKKYPYADRFARYTITIPTQTPIEITNIDTTSYRLDNYTSKVARQASLTAKASDNTILAIPASVTLQANATSKQTQAGGQETTTGTETGSNQSEPVKTLLKFASKPSSVYVNKEMSIKTTVKTASGKKLAADCHLDWGDGSSLQTEADVLVKHTYEQTGKFTIRASAVLKDSDGYEQPLPADTDLTVKVDPPDAKLSKSTATGESQGFNFTIKVEEGSYPVSNWTLSFGDGNSETGQGQVSKTINHVYAAPGSYKVELAVTDSVGTMVKKTVTAIKKAT